MKLLLFFLTLLFCTSLFATDYKQDILPIMKEHCWDCHSGKKAKGNLDLENLEEMRDYQVGKFNIIRPGDPDESSFLEKMNFPESHSDFMPRKGKKLPEPQLATIEKWIKDGAVIDSANPAEKEAKWVKKSAASTGGGKGLAPAGSQQYHRWTSSNGKNIEARFLGLQGEAVRIIMKNGTAYTVPFSRLSPESVAAAKNLAEKK